MEIYVVPKMPNNKRELDTKGIMHSNVPISHDLGRVLAIFLKEKYKGIKATFKNPDNRTC